MNDLMRRNNPNWRRVMYSENPKKFIAEQRRVFNIKDCEIGLVPFYDFEQDIIDSYLDDKPVLINKSRQMHLTTLTATYCAWCLIFKSDYIITIIGHDGSSSERFLNSVRENLMRYSDVGYNWEKSIVNDNKRKISIDNGSMIVAKSPAIDALRGMTNNLIIFDELAFIKKSEDLYNMALMNTGAFGGKVISYSTPNESGDFFCRLWIEAVGYNKITAHWSKNPKFNEGMKEKDGKLWSPWYENVCRTLNYEQDKIDRELNCLFVTNSLPASKRLNLRMDFELYQRMTQKISSENTNLSEYIRKLVEKDLE